ncbi:Kelch repeat-containing protein [Archangium violaceum]|uniref:Kelch repeat-containing protein n=1 Tax=Archangium violaceum TaxID=83451 RepID=UPI0036DF596E
MNRYFASLLLALTLVLLSGCAAPENTGSAQFIVSMQQDLDATVSRVTVVVSAEDISSLSVDLTQTGGTWSGTLDNIPSGAWRSFRAQAFDSANTLLFEGSVSGITIITRQTTLVTLLLQQVDSPSTPQYEAPVIDSLVASPTTVIVGESSSLVATARDANPGDTLTYAWTATAGTFSAATSASTSWTAPATPGLQTLTLTVRDSSGLSTSASVAIDVILGEEEGSARLSIGFNRAPLFTTLTASPTLLAVGEATTVSAGASDLDGDEVSYAWSASCAGTWSSTTSSTASFTPSALPSTACNNCRLSVTLADGRGLSSTGSVSLCVSNAPRINHFPPRIIHSSQSSATAAPGATVSFEVGARDPESTALAFAWSANTGVQGAPITGATTSRVSWTAPACAVTGTPTTLTATVTNALSLATSKSFTLTGLPACPSGWATAGSLATARASHTVTRLPNGKVLVAGGYHHSIGALASVELYDPSTGTWSTTGSLAAAHHTHTATLLPNGKVLVAGGDTSAPSSAELYDPATGTWSTTGRMITLRRRHTATLLPNGKVLIAGGFSDSSGYLASAELYDPSTGTWSTTGSLAAARGGHSAALLPNGKVLIAGGFHSASGILASAELYDPATETWSTTGALATARYDHPLTLLPNGEVLAAGGNNRGSLASAELYDPATGTWRATGALVSARYHHPAVLLPSGEVLVMGGDGALSLAELYTPATGTWRTTSSLSSGRYNHRAILLPNGKVFIAGGYTSSAIASAELYTP